ncbi:exodeoxyribonuclease VII large subunit [Desulfuribacillus stibiiarsenatis]|uniref:Exodeoxyribonuclease 7 large subunit n=2 Tax=Desulfuribacillus stibiiarsenatis TaxID=1390249 RepID=A0A1E5L722_9FIRM|nr:exodeoxyribonuclease VII large subunit [Desulfuribacillus stibiiarsenatis]
MKATAWSVSQLTKYIKNIFENDWQLTQVWVQGEISNFTRHSSGHMYFSIKDDKSVIRSIMFAGNNRGLQFIPKNGMKVIIKGYVTVFERDGQYQLYAQEMIPDGVGNLYLAFEQLKSKLKQEGLFDELDKKLIPFLPKGIAVITSNTGAAIRDVLTTVKRRNPLIPVYVIPATVQGVNAPGEICQAISLVETKCAHLVDVILLVRGGGSIEELWAFNEEIVARKIHECSIPIVVGVGHETDFTIADFVADLRAPTPTGAAELVSPPLHELNQGIIDRSHRLQDSMHRIINRFHERLAYMQNSKVLTKPELMFTERKTLVDWLTTQMQNAIENKVEKSIHQYQLLNQRLDDLSPLKIMGRGFSIIHKIKTQEQQQEKELVLSVKQVKVNEQVNVTLLDGELQCTVWGIQNGKKK